MKNSNAEPASVGSRVPRDRANPSWPMVRLGDVCKFQRGLTYKKSDEVAQSENIVLRSNNIDLEQGVLDLRELKCIREDLSVPEDKKVMPGSILMCMANGSKSHLGKVALVQDDLGYAFGGFMGLLVPEGIDSSYLYLALRSAPFKECIRKLQDGANINNLKFSDLCDFPIPLPPLPVQREIVARLEKELGEADALAAKFKDIAGNADAEFKAELDETFKNVEGEKVRLGDVVTFKGGYAFKSKEYTDDGIQVVRISDLDGLDVSDNDAVFFPEQKGLEKYIIDSECILICLTGSIGKMAMVRDGIKRYLNQRVGMLNVMNSVELGYIWYFLHTERVLVSWEKAKTSVNGNLRNKDITDMPLIVPPFDAQRTIVAKLDAAKEKYEKLKAAAERGLRAAEDLRKSILAEAFEQ